MSEEFKYKTSSDSRKKKSFVPRIVHILLAIIVIVVLSILIFTNADFNKGRDYTHLRYSKMKSIQEFLSLISQLPEVTADAIITPTRLMIIS